MLSGVGSLALTTYRRRSSWPVREVLLGLALGGAFVVGATLSLDWAVWALLVYVVSVQAIGLTENDVFFTAGDLRLLGYREPSLGYRLAYLGHYVARDLTWALASALVVACGGLVAVGLPWAAGLVAALLLGSLALLPSHVFLASRASESARTRYVLALVGVVLAAAGGLALGYRLPPSWWAPAPGIVLAVGFGWLLLLDRISGRLRGRGLSGSGTRRWFAWLRPRAPFLFKDLVLFGGMIVQALLSGLAMFGILMSGSPALSVGALLLLTVCHDNWLLGRAHGRYRLQSEDPFFAEERLPADRRFLRRHTVLSLAVDVPLKLALAVAFLLTWDVFVLDHALLLAGTLVTVFVMEASLPWTTTPLARWLRGFLTYAMFGTYFAVTSLGQPLALAWVYAGTLVACYLPSLVAVLRDSSPATPLPGATDGTPPTLRANREPVALLT